MAAACSNSPRRGSMNQAFSFLTLIASLGGFVPEAQGVQRPSRPAPGPRRPVISAMRLPVVFEQNSGQAPEQVRFLVRKPDHSVFFLRNEIVFSAGRRDTRNRKVAGPLGDDGDIVTMQLVDAGGEGPQIGEAMKA